MAVGALESSEGSFNIPPTFPKDVAASIAEVELTAGPTHEGRLQSLER